MYTFPIIFSEWSQIEMHCAPRELSTITAWGVGEIGGEWNILETLWKAQKLWKFTGRGPQKPFQLFYLKYVCQTMAWPCNWGGPRTFFCMFKGGLWTNLLHLRGGAVTDFNIIEHFNPPNVIVDTYLNKQKCCSWFVQLDNYFPSTLTKLNQLTIISYIWSHFICSWLKASTYWCNICD